MGKFFLLKILNNEVKIMLSLEKEIFKSFIPDFEKLIEYGFLYKNEKYYFEKTFLNGNFKVVIEISNQNKINSMVYDVENNEEYIPLKIDFIQDAFVGKVRSNYKEILNDIAQKCFNKSNFLFPQTNRIVKTIKEKYGDEPSFLWEKSPNAVFKNSKTNKWYGLIINIDFKKIDNKKEGEIEILNIKLDKDKIQTFLKNNSFYPAYHMNKKHWISIVLNEKIADEKIIKLLEESYQYTNR